MPEHARKADIEGLLTELNEKLQIGRDNSFGQLTVIGGGAGGAEQLPYRFFWQPSRILIAYKTFKHGTSSGCFEMANWRFQL